VRWARPAEALAEAASCPCACDLDACAPLPLRAWDEGTTREAMASTPLPIKVTTAPARPWRATVLTLFPDLFPGPLAASLSGEALRKGIWRLHTLDIRPFGHGKHRSVDDPPAGGGAGMVLRADVLGAAVDAARAHHPEAEPIYLSPRGEPFSQAIAQTLSEGPGVLLLAGRFEGVDQRVIDARHLREISIGDYVLAGGELPAMVLIDAVVRLLPGVLGEAGSLSEESFAADLLEYPQFTRPRAWEGQSIPAVLLSGDHARIAQWRRHQSERLTQARRPDLWARRRREEGS
jgi:tRNA (guanine37-N1)-methyltransferase